MNDYCHFIKLTHLSTAIIWIRGEKTEHIIQGRKQGATMPKDKSVALRSSMRSLLSKASFYHLVKEAGTGLQGDREEILHVTYFQAKHSEKYGQSQYRADKDRLRGSVDPSVQVDMVKAFLAMNRVRSKAEAKAVKGDDIKATASLSNQAPFYGWLVSGEAMESFY